LIIGAGQGATLGAMWLANESYRRRDKNAKGFAQPNLGDPEVQDVAGCIWLTISPSIDTRNVGASLKNTWLVAAGRTNKVPMLFYYGSKDGKGKDYASDLAKHVKGGKDLKVKTVAIEGTNLTGSKLLDKSVNTLVIKHLPDLLDARGIREQRDKKVEDNTYYYLIPPSKFPLRVPNKKAGEEVPPVDLGNLLK
jgi:hypothetical protein